VLGEDFRDLLHPQPQGGTTRDRRRSDVADSQELEEVQKRTVHSSIEHLHGPKSVACAKDELIVLTQVRNSRPYLRSFLAHYFSLGAKHIVFLDNVSTDGTVEALGNCENVTVLRTALPFRIYNVAMRQYLIERFGKGRWTLLVDIDELFDCPFSDVVSLDALLNYLNEHSYTAVVAHMLEMFSEVPISRDASLAEDEPLREKYRFYDVSNIDRQRYEKLAKGTGNVVSNEDIEVLRGGIRNTLFGNWALLLKHPLVFLDDKLRPMDLSEHWVANARIADFSGVLYHYKFTDRFYEDVRRSVEERNRSDHGTTRYSKFLEVLESNPSLRIRQETARWLESTDDLVGCGFVVVSKDYLSFVKEASGNAEDSLLAERIGSAERARHKLAEKRLKSQAEQLDVPATPELRRVQRFVLRLNVEHLYGPEEVELAKDDLVVLCLMENGRPYVKSFVEHYLSLGAKHIVFLDIGSTDGTTEALKAFENVTVLKTTMPFRRYQLLMRQYLVEQFGKNHWSLLVDIDELFDYPYSDVIGLKSLLRYLNEHQYTAVVAHMLDMFPEELLSESAGNEDVPIKESHRFYDISNISAFDYQGAKGVDNVVSNEDIKMLQGGVKRTLFNRNSLLIKHPLIFYDDEVKPVHLSEHWAENARVADFSGVLFNYKLLGTLYNLVRQKMSGEMSERNYINGHGKYDKYLKVLDAAPEFLIKRETSKELKSVNDLVGTQFAVVSREYMNFVEQEERREEGSHYSEQKHTERLFEAFFNARSELKVYNKKVRNLEQQLKKLRAEVKEPPRNNRARASRSDAEVQLREIQSSRTWKVFTMVVRLNIGVKSALGRLKRRGLQREG
jgi:Glycosyl transferase family 2